MEPMVAFGNAIPTGMTRIHPKAKKEAEHMLEFRRNGRKMSRMQFFDGLQKDMSANTEDAIEHRLKSLHDPKTGQPVKSTKQRRNGDATWKVEGSPQAVEATKNMGTR